MSVRDGRTCSAGLVQFNGACFFMDEEEENNVAISDARGVAARVRWGAAASIGRMRVLGMRATWGVRSLARYPPAFIAPYLAG